MKAAVQVAGGGVGSPAWLFKGGIIIMEMDAQSAREFFAILYYGEHHIPNEVKPFGLGGWSVLHVGDLSSWDFNFLTRLVFLAHDKAVRVSVQQGGPKGLRIAIWQRQRAGGISERHPTLAEAILEWREYPFKRPKG